LSQFSRRARWLNTIFPASVLPQSSDPGIVSDDVSLVSAYDGGGLGFQKVVDFRQLATGASGNTTFVLTGPEEVFRLYCISTHALALGGTTLLAGILIDKDQPLFSVSAGVIPILSGNPSMWPTHIGMIGPNLDLQISYSGGVGGTIIGAAIYGFRAPLGTVFQV